jgi:hypothetical protein
MPMQVATLLGSPFDRISPDLDAYVRNHKTDRWLLFSDYVLRQKQRKTSTITFTLVPGGDYFEPSTRAVINAALADFKNAGIISHEMLELLADSRLCTFCFVAFEDDLPRFSTVNDARTYIRDALHSLGTTLDVQGHAASYDTFVALQQRAQANNFNFLLLGDILLVSTLAAYIAQQLGRRTGLHRFGWFSDRDKLVEAYGGFAYTAFAIAVSEYWQEIEKGSAGPSLGVNPPNQCADRAWFDGMTRVPDHYAGAVAGWDLSNKLDELPTKYRQVLAVAARCQKNVHIVHINPKGYQSRGTPEISAPVVGALRK